MFDNSNHDFQTILFDFGYGFHIYVENMGFYQFIYLALIIQLNSVLIETKQNYFVVFDYQFFID